MRVLRGALKVELILACLGWSTFACCGTFAEADIDRAGVFALAHSNNGSSAKATIAVLDASFKDPAKPIGNLNYVSKLQISLNGKKLSIPNQCQQKLLDVRYIRLAGDGSAFLFVIQGGDGAEVYQVVLQFAKRQPTKCSFLPKPGDQAFEPLISKKTIEMIRKKPVK